MLTDEQMNLLAVELEKWKKYMLAARGEVITPFGYIAIKKEIDGKPEVIGYQPDPKIAPILQDLFHLVAEREISIHELAEELDKKRKNCETVTEEKLKILELTDAQIAALRKWEQHGRKQKGLTRSERERLLSVRRKCVGIVRKYNAAALLLAEFGE